jgi:hypothetical protein
MSQPQPERHTNGAPYTDPALDEQQTGDGEQAGQAAPEFSALHIVRPVPEPEKPATPKTDARIVRQLTWDEIKYFIDHDPDKFFDEDFYRDLQFDRAIDLDPEIE